MNDNTEALPPLERAIDDYLDGYVLEGDDGYHLPTEHEKLIVKDAIMGLLEESEFCAALAARGQAQEGAMVAEVRVPRPYIAQLFAHGVLVRSTHDGQNGFDVLAALASEVNSAALAQRQQVPEGWREALMAASIALRQLSERAKQVKAALDADLPDGTPVHPQSRALTWPISTALLAIDKVESALTAVPSAQAEPVAQEVGHLHSNGDFCQTRKVEYAVWPVPLYAAPPAAQAEPQVPLTDEQIDGLRGLDTASRVRFYEHDFYVLSNFSAFNLQWKGLTFPTSEHAYHWEKFAPHYTSLRDHLQSAPSAHEAFKLAECNRHCRREDWDDVKVGIMLDILREKARQHEYVRRKLLATGDRELVEDSWRDDFWGWGPNRDGKNMLGKLWMQVRAELRGITKE